jgi:hypothetical protein
MPSPSTSHLIQTATKTPALMDLNTIWMTTPHMRGMNPMTGLSTTRLLVSARFDSTSRTNFGVFTPSARRIATNASQTP